MPKVVHETLTDLFRDRPALAADLLEDALGFDVPPFAVARLSGSEFTQTMPTEYRADAVVTFDDGDRPKFAIIVEVQLREDPRKRQTWPLYTIALHNRLNCDVVLLAVCPTLKVAKWAATTVVMGIPPAAVQFAPAVLGPEQIPLVTDVEVARETPELALLSTMAHGGGPDAKPVLEAYLAGVDNVGRDRARLYNDLVYSVLPEAARIHLEELMTITGNRNLSDFARRYLGEGEAKGKSEALLMFLDSRGIAMSDDVRGRIASSTDVEQIDSWIRQVATITRIDELTPPV